MTDTPQIMTEADLTPISDDVDHRFAGEPLDPWLGYVVEDSVRIAIEAASARPQLRIIAFVVPLQLNGDFRTFIERQKRAGRAHVAEHYPHLKVNFRTITAPFRGVGSDVRVFYVVAGPEKEQAVDGS